MTRILITGDSWAVGEWPAETREGAGVSHSGMREYLAQQGHSVWTRACGGDSNRSQLRHLLDPRLLWDIAVFVHTDPVRSWRQPPHTAQDLLRCEQENQQEIESTLRRVTRPVLLVSGCVALPEFELPPPHHRLPDWVEQLTGTRPTANLCRDWQYPDHPEAALIDRWHSEESALSEWLSRCRDPGTAEHQWFWPDGRHPNRRAHQWLTQRILDHLRAYSW